jgi:uncharacterized membrane protein YedE/YeeE
MMDAPSFWQPLLGGVLIGLAAALLLWLNGRLAGVSSMLGGVVAPVRGDVLWRVLALLGLVFAGIAGMVLAPEQIGRSPRSLGMLTVAGLCVGIGTRLSSGCTSGHGVCGVGRLSPRSLIATATFVATGVLTVLVLRLLGDVS